MEAIMISPVFPANPPLLVCSTVLTIVILLSVAPVASGDMVDPAIDASGPFAYLSKPSTTIGVKAGPEASQITFDGAIYTGYAELCFVYGHPLRPVMVRQKQLLEGWMPIVQYGWHDGAVDMHLEAFGATLDDNPTSTTVNFVQISLKNHGSQPTTASFAAAIRFSGEDHRCEAMRSLPFSPEWRYEMTEDCILREDSVICIFPGGAKREAVPGVDYTTPFRGRQHNVSERSEVCLARYAVELAPGASQRLTFKMPLVPVARDDREQLEAIRAASYDRYRQRTIDFWRTELAKGAQIHIPEKKVVDMHRASLVYDLIAIDEEDGQWVQKVNEFQYDRFWLRDGAYIIRTYDLLGHHETAARCLEHFLAYQRPDGLFLSQGGQLDGFGQALFALGQHYVMTGDLDFARQVYKHIPPAIAWLKQARAADEYHLMPPTHARDNENIEGRYTGHNFWALLGLRMAVILARATGHDDDAKVFLAEYEDFHQALMKRLDEVCGPDGYIPPGLDVEGGNDWGNLLGVYPTEVLEPLDLRVTTTLAKMHREKYEEGIMTYDRWLHHYLTTNVTQTHVVRGEQLQAITDFYHLLLHTGSTHEGFEFSVLPWQDRDSGRNYPPHGWCAAKLNALLRNMLVQERGGRGGLEARELHLFSVISPAWAIPGEEVSIRNAPTEMGPISATLSFTAGGATLLLETRLRQPPRNIVLHVPSFVTLTGFETDARETSIEDHAIVMSPDVSRATLTWARNPVAPISYASVVEDYRREYARRYAAYLSGGGKPASIEAPELLTPERREELFKERWGPNVVGIAVGRPVTVSGGTEPGHPPELAVDGNAGDRNGSSWWAGPPTPRYLQIDLEAPTRIDTVQVFPYWDGQRYYQYTVELSRDGQDWIRVVDMSDNTRPSTEAGHLHSFPPVEARYVRVNMLHNSANQSVHLVEVRVFPAD
jgi:hypothetical protein